MVKHANRVFVTLDAVAIMIALRICLAIIISVKIHVKIIFAAIMLCVKSKIIWQNVNVQPVLKGIQRPNKDAFGFHLLVFQLADAQMDTCALEIFVKYLVANQRHVQSVKDAITMYVQKFALPITIVCRVKFVMNVVRAKRAVTLKPIAHQRKFVPMENVNVAVVSLEHHLDALILMSVRNKFVIKVPSVRIRPVHLNVFAPSKLLAIHTQHLDACYRINVFEMKTALKI